MKATTDALKGHIARGCGALIVNERNETLLLLRSGESRNDQGMWSQPGGAIDDDNAPHVNVVREVYEEVGVEIEVREFLTATSHGDLQHDWIAYSFLGSITRGEPRRCEPLKHVDMQWIPVESLPLNTNKVTRDSVEAFLQLKRGKQEKGLIILDMDGTILPDSSANLELSRAIGAELFVNELEVEFATGRLSSTDYCQKVLSLYRRLTPTIVKHAFENTQTLCSLEKFVTWARNKGYNTALITTGPLFFAAMVKEAFSIDEVCAADIPLSETAALDDCVLLHSTDKPIYAHQLCSKFNVTTDRCICIGDSWSDIPLFRQFPNTIALNAGEALEKIAKCSVRSRCALDLVPVVRSLLCDT